MHGCWAGVQSSARILMLMSVPLCIERRCHSLWHPLRPALNGHPAKFRHHWCVQRSIRMAPSRLAKGTDFSERWHVWIM